MSYDLFFQSNPAGTPITGDTFRDYFSNRSHYKTDDRGQAWYSNEDTGVYFLFELSQPEKRGEERDVEQADASFNLNYYRPHIFGLEAEPEVASFVATFRPSITDPQVAGMTDGRYSGDAFLLGWNTGNAFGYRAVGSQQGPKSQPLTLPSAAIERFWRWNYGRGAKQRDVGESIFVPRVMFLRSREGVASFVVWGDAMPILLPEVDLVIIIREQLAPRRLFRRKTDRALASWAQILPAIAPYSKFDEALAYYRLDFPAPPNEIVSFIESLSPHVEELKGIAVSDVLDHELWANRGAS